MHLTRILMLGLLRTENRVLNGRKSGTSIFLRESVCLFGELANRLSQLRSNFFDATSPLRPTALIVVWCRSPAFISLWSAEGLVKYGVVSHLISPNLIPTALFGPCTAP